MKNRILKCLGLLILISSSILVKAQTNLFPLFSSGTFGGGSSPDFTDLTSFQLKLQATSGYIRVPHLSSDATVSTVYNFQTGKNVYWGEPADLGSYFFRGRNFIVQNGNVGIGTSSPAYKLQVTGGAIALDNDEPLRGGGKWLISGNQTAVTVGTANPGVNLRFMSGADSERMRIDAATGNVGIGTTSPNQKLTVNGTIYGKEVKVDLNVPGPDYVFEENYNLPSLTEIENYIKQNKHLPEVPSAKEMETNGINLSEMNMILLKKVEELTLHLIEMKKQMGAQEKRIVELTKN